MCLLSNLMCVCVCVCVQRSRKRSSVDVHQKGSQRQRRMSALHEVCPAMKAVHLVLNALKDTSLSHAAMKQCLSLLHVFCMRLAPVPAELGTSC